jgi:hypothetical protein
MLTFGFFTGFYLVLSGLHLTLGIGLTRLQSWARWTDVVLLLISLLFLLLAAGVGVLASLMNPNAAGGIVIVGVVYGFFGLIMGYMLYLLLSKKGSMVFSPEYKLIIERTPHLRYKTSWLFRIVLIIFVALITIFVALNTFGVIAFISRPG